MEVRPYVLGVIAGMALVTVIPRVLPLVLLSRLSVPDWLVRWLGYVPVAILSALLADELLLPGDHLALPPENLGLVAIVPALGVGLYTRHLMAAVLAGVVTMALLRYFF